MQTEAVFSGPIELQGLQRRIEACADTAEGRPMPGSGGGGERIRAQARYLPSLASAARELRGTERRVLAGGLAAVDNRRASAPRPSCARFHRAERPIRSIERGPAGSDTVVEVAAPDGKR